MDVYSLQFCAEGSTSIAETMGINDAHGLSYSSGATLL
jgi:hypothetical protein